MLSDAKTPKLFAEQFFGKMIMWNAMTVYFKNSILKVSNVKIIANQFLQADLLAAKRGLSASSAC